MSRDEKDPPIQPLDYLSGVKVVDIGDLRIARGMSRRPHSSCPHHNMVFDAHERRIWCQDCETNLDPFEVVVQIATNADRANADMERRQRDVAEAESRALISLAAKNIDRVWRSRNMVPMCPCCGAGIFPEDFRSGIPATLGRDYAAARRKAMNRPLPDLRRPR